MIVHTSINRSANSSAHFPTCPNCQIGDTDTIWSLVIDSQCTIEFSGPPISQLVQCAYIRKSRVCFTSPNVAGAGKRRDVLPASAANCQHFSDFAGNFFTGCPVACKSCISHTTTGSHIYLWIRPHPWILTHPWMLDPPLDPAPPLDAGPSLPLLWTSMI